MLKAPEKSQIPELLDLLCWRDFMLREGRNLLQPFLMHWKAPYLCGWKMLSPAHCSPVMQKAMNSTCCVGDFRNDRDGLNSDPNRYLNSVPIGEEIEKEGDYLFIYLLKIVHFQTLLKIWA